MLVGRIVKESLDMDVVGDHLLHDIRIERVPVLRVIVCEPDTGHDHSSLQVQGCGIAARKPANLGVASHGYNFSIQDRNCLSDGSQVRVDLMVVHGHDLSIVENGVRCLLSPQEVLSSPAYPHHYRQSQNPLLFHDPPPLDDC